MDDRLLECRGTIVDKDWNVVVLPFKKIFNYGENGTTVDPELDVIVPRKMNGFMGCITRAWEDMCIYSTSGSMTSDHNEYIKELVTNPVHDFGKGFTYIFEICHQDDPHIINEEVGAYLIGIRNIRTGELLTENQLDIVAKEYGWKRPTETLHMPFKEALVWCNTARHEGGVIRDAKTGEPLCKIKSKHYLSKKCLMRVGRAAVPQLYANPEKFKERLDEEFYSFVDHLVSTLDEQVWVNMTDQERRWFIERFYNYAGGIVFS